MGLPDASKRPLASSDGNNKPRVKCHSGFTTGHQKGIASARQSSNTLLASFWSARHTTNQNTRTSFASSGGPKPRFSPVLTGTCAGDGAGKPATRRDGLANYRYRHIIIEDGTKHELCEVSANVCCSCQWGFEGILPRWLLGHARAPSATEVKHRWL